MEARPTFIIRRRGEPVDLPSVALRFYQIGVYWPYVASILFSSGPRVAPYARLSLVYARLSSSTSLLSKYKLLTAKSVFSLMDIQTRSNLRIVPGIRTRGKIHAEFSTYCVPFSTRRPYSKQTVFGQKGHQTTVAVRGRSRWGGRSTSEETPPFVCM